MDGVDNFLYTGFVDSLCNYHPHLVAYSYWRYWFKARERNASWRLDYFLLSKSLIDKIKSVVILTEFYGSEHCPVRIGIKF